jgi:opacity protein-like surface antigen
MMKITKWIVGLSSLVVCQEAFPDSPFEGVRACLQGGYGTLDTKIQFTRTDTVPIGKDTSDVSGRGVLGGIAIDWMNLVGNTKVLMGPELSFNYCTTKGKKSTIGTFVPNTATGDLSTTALFKRAVDLKLGPSSGHWKASTASNSHLASGSAASTSIGFVVALGTEFCISNRFSWGAEYSYRHHKDYTLTLVNSNSTIQRQINIQPSSSAFMFRINYKLSSVDYSDNCEKKERKRKKYKRPKESDEPSTECKKPPKNCRKP